MASEKCDTEKMLQLCIYHNMKKKNLHEAAEVFAKEANLKISELESDDELLTIFWDVFWPTFLSTMSNEAGEANTESSGNQSMEAALVMPTGLTNQGTDSSQQTTGNGQQDVLAIIPQSTGTNQQWAGNVVVSPNFLNMEGTQHVNMLPPFRMNQQRVGPMSRTNNIGNRMGQPLADLLPTPETSQHRAGKQPMNAETDYFLGQSMTRNWMAAQAFENEHLIFPSGGMPFDANTKPSAMSTLGNPSHVQLPASAESVVHFNSDARTDFAVNSSNQMDSTHLAGLNSSYERAAYLNAGENGQMRLTRRGVSDGLDPFSSATRVPTSCLQLMHQEVQSLQMAANPPQYTFSQEAQVDSGTSRTENMRIESPVWGLLDDMQAGGKEAQGQNNHVHRTGSGRMN